MTPADLYALYQQPGASLRSVAKQAGLSHWTVRKRLVDAGYSLKPVGGPELDPQEKLETISVRIDPELRRWLASLPGDEADHVREALRRYRDSFPAPAAD